MPFLSRATGLGRLKSGLTLGIVVRDIIYLSRAGGSITGFVATP